MVIEIELHRLIADTEIAGSVRGFMDLLTGGHVDQAHLGRISVLVLTVENREVVTDGRVDLLYSDLTELVELVGAGEAFKLSAVNPEGDGTAVGIRECDDGLGQVFALDPEALAVEPLVFRGADDRVTGPRWWGRGDNATAFYLIDLSSSYQVELSVQVNGLVYLSSDLSSSYQVARGGDVIVE